jgi:hypothetical protein
MVWHSSGEDRAARTRSHISVVVARHPVRPLARRITGGLLFGGLEGGLGPLQGLGFPAFRRTGFSFGNRTLTMIGVW